MAAQVVAQLAAAAFRGIAAGRDRQPLLGEGAKALDQCAQVGGRGAVHAHDDSASTGEVVPAPYDDAVIFHLGLRHMDRDDPGYRGQRDYNRLLLRLYDPLVVGHVGRIVLALSHLAAPRAISSAHPRRPPRRGARDGVLHRPLGPRKR